MLCVFYTFYGQAAGRATEDVTEKVGGELQGMVDDGVIKFPSIFTFIGRAFASVQSIVCTVCGMKCVVSSPPFL